MSDEIQLITFDQSPTAGDWSITFSGQTAYPTYASTAATIQGLLEALSNIGTGNIAVSGDYSVGFTLEFQYGMGWTDQPAVTVSTNYDSAPLTVPATTINVTETTAGVFQVLTVDYGGATGPFTVHIVNEPDPTSSNSFTFDPATDDSQSAMQGIVGGFAVVTGSSGVYALEFQDGYFHSSWSMFDTTDGSPTITQTTAPVYEVQNITLADIPSAGTWSIGASGSLPFDISGVNLTSTLGYATVTGSYDLTFNGPNGHDNPGPYGPQALLSCDGSQLAKIIGATVTTIQDGAPADIIFDGSATAVVNYPFTGSGTMAFSGTAPNSLAFSYAGGGTLAFSGTAPNTENFPFTGSGSMAFSGAASYGNDYPYTGAGTLAFSGSAPNMEDYPYTGTGSLLFSGSASSLVAYTVTGSGGIDFTGTAPNLLAISFTSSGSIIFNGTGHPSHTSPIPGTCEGLSVVPYCTESHVKEILSESGTLVRIDDPFDGIEDPDDTAHVCWAIEKATTYVNSQLLGRYSVAKIQTSTYVKWATATLACVNLCRRRGNSVPASLQEDERKYKDQLKLILNRRYDLIADTDRMPPENSDSPSVTNFAYVDWFRRTPIRRVEPTSTGPVSAPVEGGGKKYDAFDGTIPY